MPKNRILIVEDDDALRQVTTMQLEREGYLTSSAMSAELAIPILEKSSPQLVILDQRLPGMSGLDFLKRIRTEHPETAVIITTAFGTIKTAVEAMKAGACDYLAKPVHPSDLSQTVRQSLDQHRGLYDAGFLRGDRDRQDGFHEIIGSSQALSAALDVATRMASTDATVLILGETGTGKELVAKAIHVNSNRSQQPFATINCGAIPRELLESELFGHVKGAFTGALTHKKGKVEMADGGTVFLDEIGEMPLDLQVRILRLIQEREIEKVGAMAPIRVDVRIIAATHRNLMTMVKQGLFREDLYYRLLVVPIELPPLRDRAGDVEELVYHFLDKCRIRHGRRNLTVSPELLRHFVEYRWPGNVRELENTIERLVLLAKGAELTATDLLDSVHTGEAEGDVCPLAKPEHCVNLQAMEKQMILQALKQCGGNQTQAARHLGMSRRTLAYRLEKYGLYGDKLRALKHGAG